MKNVFTPTKNLENLPVEYEKFFAVSLDMLCISSYDGHFKKVNPAFVHTLGFSEEELCAKSYLDFIHPDDIEPTISEVEKQMTTKKDVLSFENRYRCKDGSYKWLSWKSAPVGDFMYAAARDVTEIKKANQDLVQARDALERANKELESFSYSVAHDLRAPARSIVGFSTLILEESNDALPQNAKGYLTRVLAAGQKMGILIDGLLSLSRLARQELAVQSVNLSALVTEILSDLKQNEPRRRVQLKIADDIWVTGDPTLLRVAMTNLLANAWKYTAKLGTAAQIEFGQIKSANERIFYVKDNGAGFDMQYAAKLFGLFQRLHTEAEFEGSGVGLATVQRIIHRHGGRIWAEAKPGLGATFFFTLKN